MRDYLIWCIRAHESSLSSGFDFICLRGNRFVDLGQSFVSRVATQLQVDSDDEYSEPYTRIVLIIVVPAIFVVAAVVSSLC